jgi:uncharacterized protein
MPSTNEGELNLDAVERLVSSDYDNKDTMHDLTHIKRVYAAAVRIAAAAQLSCDADVLKLGAYLHGVVYLEARALQLHRQLLELGLAPQTVERAMQAARESQTDADARSPEGIALHDGHLLEGGRSFLLVKSLVSGAARGSTLAEIVEYWSEHDTGRTRCVLPAAQSVFEQRLAFARSVFEELAEDVASHDAMPAA